VSVVPNRDARKPGENTDGSVFPYAIARICALQAQSRTGQRMEKAPVETTTYYGFQNITFGETILYQEREESFIAPSSAKV
jgi:hypothetical protein